MIFWQNKLQLLLLIAKIMLRIYFIFGESSEDYTTTESLKSSYFLTMIEVEKRRQNNHDYDRHHHNSGLQNSGSSDGEKTKRNAESSKYHRRIISTNFAAYFSGHEIIRYSDVNLNFDQFTIEFWIFIEGGQYTDLAVLHIYNHCTFIDLSSITIGLKETEDGRDLRMYFRLRTIGTEKYTVLSSHEKVDTLKWTHVAAVYDGYNMIIYINQAKVAVSLQEGGLFLSNVYEKCTTLDIGGNSKTFSTFRGSLDKIRISNIPKSHRDISNAMNNLEYEQRDKNTTLIEDFNPGEFLHRYYSVNGLLPELIPTKISNENTGKGVKLNIPQCGMTICDNPDLIHNYVKHPRIYMTRKLINYRVVILADDDGDKMLITPGDVKRVSAEINKVFSRYSISFKLHIVFVKNSYLYHKTSLLKCYGHCPLKSGCSQKPKPECELPCTKVKLGNRVCNPECNNEEFRWDSGDCCNKKYTNITDTCYDRKSNNRAYITVNELKLHLNLTNQNHLTIYPLKLLRTSAYLAKGTFPWADEPLNIKGGIVINVDSFRNSINDIIHELGHVFGLWHVHRGVSDIATCDDACAERLPSMTTGDLCEDTNPTPKNYKCVQQFNHTDSCSDGFKFYGKTPYRNYMGYSTGSCANEFTIQQQARMHCYIDRNYQRWQPGCVPPSPVPLPPQVLSTSSDGKKVEITWPEPVGFSTLYNYYQCRYCILQRRIKQYATSATYTNGRHFVHHVTQVLGPPNAVTCRSYIRDPFNAWYPTKNGQQNNAYLEVGFKKIVVPTGLKIWITQHGRSAIKDLVLVHVDNTLTSLGPGTAHCDTPYTRRIKITRSVHKIQLHFTKRDDKKILTGIDAIQLTSEQPKANPESLYQHCDRCRKLQLQYHVTRYPPFRGHIIYKKVKGLRFLDRDIEPGKTYSYSVQAVSGKYVSIPSAPLIFRPTDGFCGNGIIEKRNDEECDDGNNRDGDGCNMECRIEAVFNCNLQPSLCYRYDRDGVCEDHEKDEGTRDCTYLTPNGFTDQWSSKVIGKEQQSDKTCPESVIVGKPPDDLKCTLYSPDSINLTQSWYPCFGMDSETGDLILKGWIEAEFAQASVAAAVIIYFTSDGRFSVDFKLKTIVAKLKDVRGTYHSTTKQPIPINCKTNPTVIRIDHDKNKSPFRTKAVRIEFDIGYLAISGIALRSQNKPCAPHEFYNEEKSRCESENRELTPCPKIIIAKSTFNCSNDGGHCDITCNDGYVPKKTFTIHCRNGAWLHTTKCMPVDCGLLTVEHAKTSCQNCTLGGVCSFTCNSDSYLHGNDNEVTCQSNGRWSSQKSHCYRVCKEKPTVRNALLMTGSCGGDEKKRIGHEMGTRCRFQCHQGYEAKRKVNIAGVSSGNLVNVHCSSSGEWIQDSKCEPIKCPKLSRMNDLMYNCTKTNMYGSTCTTSCLGIKNLHTVTCQHDGKWSSKLDSLCKNNNVTCGQFPDIDGVDASSCSQTKYGSQCRPKCKEHRMDIVLKGKGDRKDMNEDVIFYCMPNSKWFPVPWNLLSCEKKCFGYLMRNKYCDCQNNREHCNYDNGKCCGDNVKFSSYHYGPKCVCLDPKFSSK